MKKSKGDKRPYLKPVTRIELSEKNIKQRVILLVVLLAIAAAALFTGVRELLKVEPGIQEIEVASQKPNCSQEFVLMYDFSDYGGSAANVNRELNRIYGAATEKAFALFSPDVEDATTANLFLVNRHVNETVTVDPVLYRAFEQIREAGNRCIYLAPAYVEYNRIFLCENEQEAAMYDPAFNEEQREYLLELASFVSDPAHIDLELLPENVVRLNISQEYLAFAQEYGIETFLDFGWMKNAFIADYLAQVLTENGFTRGYLSSFDGYTRNLDPREESYSVNLFSRQDHDVYMPAKLNYTGAMSLVSLRDFPMSEKDRWHYFVYSDGSITHSFLDPKDGRSKCALSSLTGYSREAGCAEILLDLIPVFVTEDFHPEALEDLAQQGTLAVWCQNQTVETNSSEGSLELLDESFSLKTK